MQMPTHIVIALTADSISLVIMGILLYALLFENSEKDKKTFYFAKCCIYAIVALICDLPAWYYENKPGHDTLLCIVNAGALIFSIGPIAYISFYLIEMIGKEHVSPIHTKLVTGMCVLAGIVTLVGVFNGKTYVIKDGLFEYGPWYTVILIVSAITLVYMECLAISKRKYLGRHSTLAFISYMIMPVISVIIETINPEISLALTGTALGALLLYVMLQSGHVSSLNVRGEILKELSYKDMMTELGNRRAYDQMLDEIEPGRFINIVFCDMNGLKYVNDKYGHAAGDRRVKLFADVLRKHFSGESIFRISGDEFVVIVPDISKTNFEKRAEQLKNALREEEDIAAMGTASGYGNDKMELIGMAENRMYTNKKENAARHPEYVRK